MTFEGDEQYPHLVHRDGVSTEREALGKVAPHITGMKRDILNALRQAGERGLTPDEHCNAIRGLINTVRRRFTDLWKEGLIRPTSMTRRNGRGNQETVWSLGLDPDLKNHRFETAVDLRKRLAELEGEVASLKVPVDEADLVALRSLWKKGDAVERAALGRVMRRLKG